MKINERSKIIIHTLLNNQSYVTANEIAITLQVSIKTVTRQLSDVEKILAQSDLKLERKTSKGMRIVGSKQAKEALLSSIEKNTHHEYSPAERGNIILSRLFKSQEPLKLIALAKLLDVTETTISNDLDKLEPWITKMNITLVRKPGLGIYFEGLEKDIRKAIINHIYTHIHEGNFLQLLYNQDNHSNNQNNINSNTNQSAQTLVSDADKFLLDLVDKNIIQKVETAVSIAIKTKEETYSLSENAFSGLVVHLTLAVQRLLKGEAIIIDNNFLAKIKTKPEFNIAKEISNEINKIFDVVVPDEEIAYIAMHLLGARNNYQQALISQYNSFQLVKIGRRIIQIAEHESGLTMAKKNKVLIGLVKHLAPAATRIKLKMEIRNPLLLEMKQNYPHWMDLAEKAAKPLEDMLEIQKLPEAEVAYLAMHLGAALEDSRQQQQNFNILVACPTGIGTSKLLASQLKKKFTQLNIIAVVSAVNIDYDFCKRENIDFIVSSVPIENALLPTIVVNFMLQDDDINAIMRQMQKSALLNKAVKAHTSTISLVDKLAQLNQYSKYISEILNGFFYTEFQDITRIDDLCSQVSAHIFSNLITDDNNDTEDTEKAQENYNILFTDLKNREAKGHTVFNKLMLLHTKSTSVDKLTVGVGRLTPSYSADKEEINIVLILIVPEHTNDIALKTIGYISENLIDNLNLFDILSEGSEEQIYAELEKIYTVYFKEVYKKIMEV